jgi:hypothetical protein
VEILNNIINNTANQQHIEPEPDDSAPECATINATPTLGSLLWASF